MNAIPSNDKFKVERNAPADLITRFCSEYRKAIEADDLALKHGEPTRNVQFSHALGRSAYGGNRLKMKP